MKNLLVVLFFTITTVSFAQIVTIPDGNFKNKLISLGVDTNTDSEIQQTEALAITSLDVSSSSISDLTGIESFLNLTNLNCFQNSLTSLNLNALTNLTTLNAGSNLLTTLSISSLTSLVNLNLNGNSLTAFDFSGLTNLTVLDCTGNPNMNTIVISGLNNLQQLECSACNLSSLNVDGLVNLTTLRCDQNPIVSLDVSDLVNLQVLDCNTCQLSALDVSGLTQLTQLYCGQNQIQVLDLTGLTNLTFIWCNDNLLTSLDVSFMLGLTQLNCDLNQLTTLDVSGLTNLNTLNCFSNQLTSLVLNNLPNLTTITCEDNQLTTLDFSSCLQILSVHCDNNVLETLFLKNGADEQDLTFANNPTLTYICVDDFQINTVQNQLDTLGMTNTACNSYCSFVPGGNYNTIETNVQIDVDANGCDSNDPTYPNIKFLLSDGVNQSATFTDATGKLNFYTQIGNFDVTPSIENASWFDFFPASATIPFTNIENNVVQQNFCVTTIGVHPDIEIAIAQVSAEVNLEVVYAVVIKNKGNQTLSGEFSLNFDDTALNFLTSNPTLPFQQETGLLKWSYTDLKPFENRVFDTTFFLETTPPSLNFSVSTTPFEGDEVVNDNTLLFHQNTDYIFEPTIITCLQGESLAVEQVGQFLHYNIKFENTGTVQAQNVVVRMDVSPLDFDINSLQVLNSSSEVYIRQTGNVVEIIFQGINIDSGGHGNVLIKIKSNGTLPLNYTITEFADIFFDYELPQETNQESITIKILDDGSIIKDDLVLVYPNPVTSNLTIKAVDKIKTVEVYDVQGRLLLTQIVNNYLTSIDLSNKMGGVYFIKVKSDAGVQIEKIIKE